MDSPHDGADRDRGQGLDPHPGGDAATDLPPALSALDARLTHLEAAMGGLDSRLSAIERHLPLVVPASKSPPPPVIATPRVLAPPPAVVAPHPASDVEPRRQSAIAVAVARVLDGPPSPGQPEPPSRLPREPARPPARQPLPLPALRQPAIGWDDLERAVSGRGLAWAGGLALLLGALFFLSLAISRGWIGIEARVAIGLVAGIVVTALGDRLMRGGDRILGPVLVSVGIGIWNLALVAGTRLYDLIPLWPALLGAAASAVIGTAIAIRANAQVIALYGMVTALAAPMLFAVPGARTPMAYLVVILAGSTAISIAKGWSWLPPVAFVVSEAQFYLWWWAGGASDRAIVLAIASLSLLHAVAASGSETWARTRGARIAASALLVLNAASFAGVGAAALGDARIAFGLYLLAGAAAHAGLGVAVAQRIEALTAFVYVAFGIAVVMVTGAIAVVFDGPAVAIGWAAEAVALVWLARRSRIDLGYAAAASVFALAVWHLFRIELRADLARAPHVSQGIPFVDAAGLTLLALLAALAAAGTIVRERLPRTACAVVGFGIVIAALPYELAGLTLLTGWALLAVLALAGGRILSTLPDEAPGDARLAWFAAHGLTLPAAVAAGLAIRQAILFEMPVFAMAQIGAGPFTAEPVIAAGVIVAAALAAGWVTESDEVRQTARSVAILVVANLAAYLLDPALAIAAWSALAVVAAFMKPRRAGSFPLCLLTSAALLVLGVTVTLAGIAPVSRLLVTAAATVDHPFLWSEATLALGALAAACFAIAHRLRQTPAAGWLALGGGVLALYLLSVGIVDAFQARVEGAASVAELRRQSQVALSVVWAILGGGAVAVGLLRAIAPARWFGLGLLALATVKVFLYDLSSLDAVYRVLSFLVLGVLLLLSSYAYRRFDGRPDDGSDAADDSGSAEMPAEPG